jgi:hypothetical protein
MGLQTPNSPILMDFPAFDNQALPVAAKGPRDGRDTARA